MSILGGREMNIHTQILTTGLGARQWTTRAPTAMHKTDPICREQRLFLASFRR